MKSEWWKRTQIVLILALVVAAVRVGMIYYERHEPSPEAKKAQPRTDYNVTQDDYVTRNKVYAYDLKSAQILRGKPVWVRLGNGLACYPYSAAARRVDFKKSSGMLAPLEKLEVKDVVLQPQAGSSGEQVMMVFSRPAMSGLYATRIGTKSSGSFNFTVDNLFFIDDPHELYKHWPADTWSAVDNHEVKLGMSELQASFALGVTGHADAGAYGNRTMEYANNGKPVTVTFAQNRIVNISK
ncbi:MAG TPA: hypothetical protein VKZ53_03120 [Candidatus Angelobacter sp.]|nr:hypothetical protein [Candidatus Angelobacter sp.]